MTEFLANVSDEVIELLREVANEMVRMFGISNAEAVARINGQWEGQGFLEGSDIILHEDAYYWALFIYFGGDVPDWSPGAERSNWVPQLPPPIDSLAWTICD